MTIQTPPNSSFPVIDFASRTLAKGFSDDSPAKILSKTANGDNNNVRNRLRDKVVFLGEVDNITVGTERMDVCKWKKRSWENRILIVEQRVFFEVRGGI